VTGFWGGAPVLELALRFSSWRSGSGNIRVLENGVILQNLVIP